MEKHDMTPEKKLDLLCKKGLELLAAYIREKVPETGKIKPTQYWFKNVMPDWHGAGYGVGVIEWHSGLDQRGVKIFAYFPGMQQEMSNYWFHGTKQEVLDFLSDPSRPEEMKQIYNELSDKIWLHD